MNWVKNLCYLFLVMAHVSCSNQADSQENQENSSNKDIEKLDTDKLPETITWNLRYYFDEFAEIASKDVFPDNELNEYAIWEYSDGMMPIIVLISYDNDFVVLTESDDSSDEPTTYKITKLNIPDEAGFSKSSSLSYEFYDMFEKDIDHDGDNEYIISAEITGMDMQDDAMYPVHFLKHIVFERHNFEANFSKDLSLKYNQVQGTASMYIKESPQEIIKKKYSRVGDMSEGLLKQSLLKSLLEDMGISSQSNDSDNAFGKVSKVQEGEYVTYSSLVGYKYLVASLPNQFDELKSIDEDYYPLMIDRYQMTDIYSIASSNVSDSVEFVLKPLPESETEAKEHSIFFKRIKDYWELSHNQINRETQYWIPKRIRRNIEVIQDE